MYKVAWCTRWHIVQGDMVYTVRTYINGRERCLNYMYVRACVRPYKSAYVRTYLHSHVRTYILTHVRRATCY